MRIAKFCEWNTASKEAVELLKKEYADKVGVTVVDCFRRCLRCQVKPFCRLQLDTIEADDAATLVEKVLTYIHK